MQGPRDRSAQTQLSLPESMHASVHDATRHVGGVNKCSVPNGDEDCNAVMTFAFSVPSKRDACIAHAYMIYDMTSTVLLAAIHIGSSRPSAFVGN